MVNNLSNKYNSLRSRDGKDKQFGSSKQFASGHTNTEKISDIDLLNF